MKRATVVIGIGLALGSLAQITGCASTRQAEEAPMVEAPIVSGSTVWLASAKPAFATIQRDTLYSVVHDPYRDLIVLEDNTPAGRYTWLLSIPASAPAGATLGVADEADPMSGGAWGWLFEDPHGGPSHVAPLRGSLTIDSRDGDNVGISLDVVANTGTPMRGARRGTREQLAGQANLWRYAPERIAYSPMDRRAGIEPDEPEVTPPIWATLWNFPEPEPPRNRFGKRQP
jgi:hypothetical protein